MRCFAVALCFVMFSIAVFGQAGTGTITGTVTDPTGAAIANAPVEVRNTDTNFPYATATTVTGAYTVLRLPPGPYSITVSAPGFKKLVRSGLAVDAGQTLPLDLALQVGSAGESVTVTAEATLTENGERRRLPRHHAIPIGRSANPRNRHRQRGKQWHPQSV